jgi:recombination protein RecA
MRSALSKAEIESGIAARFGDAFKLYEKPAAETLSTGVSEVDALTGGIPRGAVTEIFGPRSSGRTSLMYSMLAYATAHEEICALVDTNDVFAPTAAVIAEIDFDRLLWVRCAANLEHAFKATDQLLHAGGFGLVILDIGDVAGKEARRIITSWWYRFRRTVENRPTAVVVISEEACTRSCAALTLELQGRGEWSRNLLNFNSININRCRPFAPTVNESQFRARAIA